jgi:hypothetical protein
MLGALLVLLLATFAASSVAKGRLGQMLDGVDEQGYYAVLRSAVFDGDCDYRNEFTQLTPHSERLTNAGTSPTGKVPMKYGIGWAVVAAVPYLAVHGVLAAASLFGVKASYTGYEPAYQLAAALGQILAGWLGLVLTYRLMRKFFSPLPAASALLLVLFGTPLFYYVAHSVYMAHSASFFTVAGFIYVAVSLPESKPGDNPRRKLLLWAALGMFGSLMLVCRYSNGVMAVVLAYPVMWYVHQGKTGWKALAKGLPTALVAAAPILLLQVFLWHSVFGHWIVYSYGNEGFDFLHPAMASSLLSSRHGVFFFAPVAMLCCAGLVLGSVRPLKLPSGERFPRLVAIALLASAACLAYLNASWRSGFADAFGARAFVEASTPLCLGLAWLVHVLAKPLGKLVLCLGVVCASWTNLLLFMQFKNLIARDGSTTLVQILAIIRQHLP